METVPLVASGGGKGPTFSIIDAARKCDIWRRKTGRYLVAEGPSGPIGSGSAIYSGWTVSVVYWVGVRGVQDFGLCGEGSEALSTSCDLGYKNAVALAGRVLSPKSTATGGHATELTFGNYGFGSDSFARKSRSRSSSSVPIWSTPAANNARHNTGFSGVAQKRTRRPAA